MEVFEKMQNKEKKRYCIEKKSILLDKLERSHFGFQKSPMDPFALNRTFININELFRREPNT